MLEKIPFTGQVALFAAIAVAIVGCAYFIMPDLGQMKTDIQTMKDEYAEKDRQILEGRAIEQRLPEFEREIASLEQKLGDIQQILPTGRETGDLLTWIKNLSDQSNLDLKSFAPGNERPVEFYREFPIDMQVVARYHDLGMFLDRVSKYSRIINVDNLRITRVQEADKTIGATFTATTFVYDEGGVSGVTQ
ncbi:MAG: type 4a pilus biogenesis protein PilO [bacterium]|nr:type 4a pilus biogenesis protein PilO [bacterium]